MPAFARVYSINSLMFLTGTFELTTKMLGTLANSETGAKSRLVSKGSLVNMYGFTARVPMCPMISEWPSGSALASASMALLPAPRVDCR